MRYVAVDTETTGFHKPMPIEIAAQDIESGQWFCEKIRPIKPIDPGATAVHGLTEEGLKDCRSLNEVLVSFLDFLGKEPVTFIAHNAAQDKNVLVNAFQACGLNEDILEKPWICTVQMSKKKFPLKFKPMTNEPVKHTLKDCCERANIEYVDGHSALPDAQMCALIQKDFVTQDMYSEAWATVRFEETTVRFEETARAEDHCILQD